jgi:hypothetical protein
MAVQIASANELAAYFRQWQAVEAGGPLVRRVLVPGRDRPVDPMAGMAERPLRRPVQRPGCRRVLPRFRQPPRDNEGTEGTESTEAAGGDVETVTLRSVGA